jgi:hypothetical protein
MVVALADPRYHAHSKTLPFEYAPQLKVGRRAMYGVNPPRDVGKFLADCVAASKCRQRRKRTFATAVDVSKLQTCQVGWRSLLETLVARQ